MYGGTEQVQTSRRVLQVNINFPCFLVKLTFCRYYIGEKTAPILTVIIGGNHEASNYFWEL